MGADEPVIVEATGIRYWALDDEGAFFGRLDKIPAVQSYDGGYIRTEVIALRPGAIDEDAASEFVALYRRYLVDPTELQIFGSSQVGPWFSDLDRWWHNEVYGPGPRVPNEQRPFVKIGDGPIHRWNVDETVGSYTKVWPADVDITETSDDVIIKATGVLYYSALDEAAFFEWLDKIPLVRSYRGRLQTLYITVNLDSDDDDVLRWDCMAEFVALYRRYNIDMKELRALNAGRLGPWFSDPERWWHKDIFG